MKGLPTRLAGLHVWTKSGFSDGKYHEGVIQKVDFAHDAAMTRLVVVDFENGRQQRFMTTSLGVSVLFKKPGGKHNEDSEST